MRTYTLAFSIVVHCLVGVGVVVAPIVANDTLPEPRRAFEWITVLPVEPPPPPQAPIRRPSHSSTTANPDAAPVDAPDTIEKETGIEHFASRVDGSDKGIPHGVPGIQNAGLLPGPPAPPPPPAPARPIPVGGSIRPPQKIRHVAPVYPELARAARKEGIVILEAVIGDDGKVRSLRVLRSIPLLDEAALDAVRQWQFTPTLLNGQPVPVVMTVTVAFMLDR